MTGRSALQPPPVRDELDCQPRLVTHLRFQTQRVRNRNWAVVQNTVSGNFVRIDAALWEAVLLLRGECSLREWLTRHEGHFDRVSLLESVANLQRQGLLNGMPAGQGAAAAGVAPKLLNPLMIKLPLCNPSTLLSGLARHSLWISARMALSLCVGLLVLALMLGLSRAGQLQAQWQQLLSAPEQWWQYLLLYPCLKCLHELAHGLVLRRLGGEVREAGLSLLVLMPVPYVNATDVWSLPRRRDRLAVTAAGMLCDLMLASLALILWSVLQPGVITNMAFSVMLMGFVSVVMFNANPLLKFDGYYLLEDLLDSPGLARRSLAYWQYLFKCYVFRAKGVLRPLVADGERRWLLPYGAASLVYRIVISLVIATFLITQFHEIGFVLAAFSVVPLFVRPLPRLLRYLATSAQLQDQRWQAIARLSMLCLFFILPIALLPLPSSTRTEGIVWSPSQTELFAPEAGDIVQWQVANGASVRAGELLVQLQATELRVEKQRQQTQLSLLELEHAALRSRQPQDAVKMRVEIGRREDLLAGLQERIDSLAVRAPRSGQIAFPEKPVLSGQRVEQGTLLMYLVDEASVVVRAVVDQRQLGKLQAGVTRAQVRMVDDISTVLPATVSRQKPAGSNDLPSMALANNGYGGIDVQSSGESMKTVEEVFHLELALDDTVLAKAHGGLGGKAYITLRHPPETIGKRWWRSSRQLLLKHLGT